MKSASFSKKGFTLLERQSVLRLQFKITAHLGELLLSRCGYDAKTTLGDLCPDDLESDGHLARALGLAGIHGRSAETIYSEGLANFTIPLLNHLLRGLAADNYEPASRYDAEARIARALNRSI